MKAGLNYDAMHVANFLPLKEGPQGIGFWFHVAASTAQAANVLYTVFRVFRINDLLLDEVERIKAQRKTNDKGTVQGWVLQWKRMDRKRMLMMFVTSGLGLMGMWKTALAT